MRHGTHGGDFLNGFPVVDGKRQISLDGGRELGKWHMAQEENGLRDSHGAELETFFQGVYAEPFSGGEKRGDERHAVAVGVGLYDGACRGARGASFSHFLQVMLGGFSVDLHPDKAAH